MYEIPRFIVIVLVFISNANSILLVKPTYIEDQWALPGGIVEINESLDQTASRYVKEQTGLTVKASQVIGVYTHSDEESLTVTLAAEASGGALLNNPEKRPFARYFQLSDLPSLVPEHKLPISDFRSNNPAVIFGIK